jgi:hypothetical protein
MTGRFFAIAGLALTAVFALPGSALGQVPTEDSVVGVGFIQPQPCEVIEDMVFCFIPDRYIFDAHSGPAGENPHGTVEFHTGERAGRLEDEGSVTCLSVNGKRASLGVNFSGLLPGAGGSDQRTSTQLFAPHSAVIFVEDNGVAGQDRVAVQDLPSPGSAPSICPANPPPGVNFGPTYPLRGGGADEAIVVTDAPSKDQCKNGGWRRFGFTSQGQCVAFVERGPKGK